MGEFTPKGSIVVVERINQNHAPKDTVDIYGLGEYLGEEIPPVVNVLGGKGMTIYFDENNVVEEIKIEPFDDPKKERESMLEFPSKIPKIRLLHTGEIIWGYECWWRPLDLDGTNYFVEKIASGTSIRIVNLNEDREHFAPEDSN